jgi:membrane-bound inhibitor of C-type lysozyme
MQQSCINCNGYVSWTKGKGGMIMNCAQKGPDKIEIWTILS